METEADNIKSDRMNIEQFTKAIAETGISTDEACKAIAELMKELPPMGETEINLIKHNPSLNVFQKRKLIRQIKRGTRK